MYRYAVVYYASRCRHYATLDIRRHAFCRLRRAAGDITATPLHAATYMSATIRQRHAMIFLPQIAATLMPLMYAAAAATLSLAIRYAAAADSFPDYCRFRCFRHYAIDYVTRLRYDTGWLRFS